MNSERRVNFLGCPLDLLTSAALLDELSRHIDSRTGSDLHLLSPSSGANSEARPQERPHDPACPHPSPPRPGTSDAREAEEGIRKVEGPAGRASGGERVTGLKGEVSIPLNELSVPLYGSSVPVPNQPSPPRPGRGQGEVSIPGNELGVTVSAPPAPRIIQFVNANKVAQVREDSAMEQLMWRAHYVLADGQPILPMARLLGIRIPERIDGIGLMGKILALADRRGYSVFLLGAKQDIVEACISKIRRDYPGIRIAGYRNGYFKPDQAASVAAEVRAVQPDILFLGMGSPMKERFADQYAAELGAAVIQGVGGSFDVMAGLVKRAPIWIQRIGFEWLYRVWQEPRRMFWRYLKTNTQCLLAFLQALAAPSRHARRPTPGLSA